MESKIFLIDFDGTCVTHKYPELGNEIGASYVLKKLVEAGHKLILWTMRCDRIEEDNTPYGTGGLTQAVKWFESKDIELYGVNENPTQKSWTHSPKAYGHICIDDTALGCPLLYHEDEERPFVDWGEILYMLEKKGLLEKNPETHFKIQQELSWMYIK